MRNIRGRGRERDLFSSCKYQRTLVLSLSKALEMGGCHSLAGAPPDWFRDQLSTMHFQSDHNPRSTIIRFKYFEQKDAVDGNLRDQCAVQ